MIREGLGFNSDSHRNNDISNDFKSTRWRYVD